MDRIISLVEQVSSDYRNFDYQYADYLAIYPLIEKRPDFKPDKNYRSPIVPGSESLFASRANVEKYELNLLLLVKIMFINLFFFLFVTTSLRLYGRNIWQLCSTLNEIGSITIYNSLFVPREVRLRSPPSILNILTLPLQYLIERLKKLLKSVYARVMTLPADQQPFKDEQTTPQPPSVVTKTLSVYMHVIKDLESYVDIDVSRIIKDVLLTQAWAPYVPFATLSLSSIYLNLLPFRSVGVAGGKLDWLESKSFEYLDNYIKTMATWYSDFFNKRLTGPSAAALHICYSSNRKGFYTRRGLVRLPLNRTQLMTCP